MLSKAVIAITLCVIGGALAGQSPVFLWGANSVAKPSLQTVPKSEFAALIAPLLKDHMIVAFQEQDLSSSDFLCTNTESSQSCYAHLQSAGEKTYYSSVESPSEALRTVAAEREFNTVGKSGKLENAISCAPGKVVFVSFEDAGNNRASNLEAHDAAISSISSEISCPVVYLYMASPSSSSTPAVAKYRARRDTAASTGGYLFRDGSRFLLFFTQLILKTSGANPQTITINSMTVNNGSDTKFSVSLLDSTGKDLTFDMSLLPSGYFQMSNVAYNGINFRSNDVNAPPDFSYSCGNLTLAGIPTADGPQHWLVWNSLQLQAPFGRTTNEQFAFGDGWSCLSFFSPGILMGLLVMFLLLGIMFTGVMWMMDMNTMDRFDDPKGKTITVNVSE